MNGIHVLPDTLLSSDIWSDTGKITGTYSAPRWADNAAGDSGIRKPGRFVPNGLEAAREVVASRIGQWIDVDIPLVELIETHPDGPCCVSRAISGPVIPYGQVMRAPFAPPHLKAAASAALSKFAPAIVLDALVGNCDRLNDGNVVYSESIGAWYTLDYSLSFNLYQPTGVGDPHLPFGSQPHLRQAYFPEIIEAIRLSPDLFLSTVALAETITDDEIERLFALLPLTHTSAQDARSMRDFVKIRRSAIRAILRDWCVSASLGGLI